VGECHDLWEGFRIMRGGCLNTGIGGMGLRRPTAGVMYGYM
jgi:hypothetical protein